MLAIDVIASLLIVGVLLLCATTTVAALSVPSIDWSHRRRQGGRQGGGNEPTSLDELVGVHTRAITRRVVTGHWEGQAPVPGERPAAIEMSAISTGISTGQDAEKPDVPRLDGDTDVAAAEAFISEILDKDPRRLADLMLQWIASDSEQPDGDDRR